MIFKGVKLTTNTNFRCGDIRSLLSALDMSSSTCISFFACLFICLYIVLLMFHTQCWFDVHHTLKIYPKSHFPYLGPKHITIKKYAQILSSLYETNFIFLPSFMVNSYNRVYGYYMCWGINDNISTLHHDCKFPV